MRAHLVAALLTVALVCPALAQMPRAQTPEEWVALANQLHGKFDAFTALGIRIGRDALWQHGAQPHEVMITYYGSESAARTSVADGVAVAISEPNAMHSEALPMRAGELMAIMVRHTRTPLFARYVLLESSVFQLEQWSRELSPVEAYKTVMAAQGLYQTWRGHSLLLRGTR